MEDADGVKQNAKRPNKRQIQESRCKEEKRKRGDLGPALPLSPASSSSSTPLRIASTNLAEAKSSLK